MLTEEARAPFIESTRPEPADHSGTGATKLLRSNRLISLTDRSSGAGPRLMVLIHHTDADREWAYDRESHIGRLDKALDEALARGWTVVDMKEDWAAIYPFERQGGGDPTE